MRGNKRNLLSLTHWIVFNWSYLKSFFLVAPSPDSSQKSSRLHFGRQSSEIAGFGRVYRVVSLLCLLRLGRESHSWTLQPQKSVSCDIWPQKSGHTNYVSHISSRASYVSVAKNETVHFGRKCEGKKTSFGACLQLVAKIGHAKFSSRGLDMSRGPQSGNRSSAKRRDHSCFQRNWRRIIWAEFFPDNITFCE